MWNQHSASHSIPHRYSYRRIMGALCIAVVCFVALPACAIQIGGSTAPGPGTTVPLSIVHGSDGSTLALVAVRIDGHGPFQFAVDTGASNSVIEQSLANQLDLPNAGAPQSISGVSSKETAQPVKVASWSAGKLKLPSAVIDSANLFDAHASGGVQGLLGSDIWNQFGKITIDYSAGTLTVYGASTGP